MAPLKSSNSTTDGGSVSDGSAASTHRREREPSDSSLSSRAESLVDSQVTTRYDIGGAGIFDTIVIAKMVPYHIRVPSMLFR